MEQKLITSKFAILSLALFLVFGTALTVFAYEDLEIEINIKSDTTEVEVEYEEDDEDVKEEYEYNTTNLDEVYVLLAAELDLTIDEVKEAVEDVNNEDDESEEAADEIEDAKEAIGEAEAYIANLDEEDDKDEIEAANDLLVSAKGYLEEAEEAFSEEDYETAKDKAEEAEDKAEMIFEDEDEDDEDFCERTSQAAGWGVVKKCVDDDDYVVNDKLANKVNRFQDFGKSQDREVLQGQLRELLLLLIELLQAQVKASN